MLIAGEFVEQELHTADSEGLQRVGETSLANVGERADPAGFDVAGPAGARTRGAIAQLRLRADRRQAAVALARIASKSRSSRLAPPTNAPLTPSSARISDAFLGLTEPP
jgi:hypothetical protein